MDVKKFEKKEHSAQYPTGDEYAMLKIGQLLARDFEETQDKLFIGALEVHLGRVPTREEIEKHCVMIEVEEPIKNDKRGLYTILWDEDRICSFTPPVSKTEKVTDIRDKYSLTWGWYNHTSEE